MLKRPKGNADGGSGGDYVGEHVGARGRCARGVRARAEGRDLRGRADE